MTRTRICQNLRNLWMLFWLFALSPIAHAQTLMPMPASQSERCAGRGDNCPHFRDEKLARTFMLDIPAPRGQITDRNGVPLAQNRLSYNLVITFPTPLNFSDAQALSYTREKIDEAGKLIGRRYRRRVTLFKCWTSGSSAGALSLNSLDGTDRHRLDHHRVSRCVRDGHRRFQHQDRTTPPERSSTC